MKSTKLLLRSKALKISSPNSKKENPMKEKNIDLSEELEADKVEAEATEEMTEGKKAEETEAPADSEEEEEEMEESKHEDSEEEEMEEAKSEDSEEEEMEEAKSEDSEEEEEVSSEYSEEVAALASGEESLSEGFKAKAATIFEAAVSAKVAEEKKSLEESFEAKLNAEVAEVRDDLIEKIDSYLTAIGEEWLKENEVAIDSGLRSEISEDFMKSLKDLFVESYIEVPEGKTDILEEVEEKVTTLESELGDAVVESNALRIQLDELLREKIVNESCEGLTLSQSEKLKTLTEGVDYVDEETFTEKVKTIKESYFIGESTEENFEEETMIVESSKETVIEGETDPTKVLNPTMQKYNAALNSMQKF
jgi:hypothetical protein